MGMSAARIPTEYLQNTYRIPTEYLQKGYRKAIERISRRIVEEIQNETYKIA